GVSLHKSKWTPEDGASCRCPFGVPEAVSYRREASLTKTHLLSSRLSLLVLESHQICAPALADFTANRELHPALKTFSVQLSLFSIARAVLSRKRVHVSFALAPLISQIVSAAQRRRRSQSSS